MPFQYVVSHIDILEKVVKIKTINSPETERIFKDILSVVIFAICMAIGIMAILFFVF